MYEAIYKCRMCGETFARTATDNEQKAIHALTQLCMCEESGYLIFKNVGHDCSNGSIGYADFVGFRKENGNA